MTFLTALGLWFAVAVSVIDGGHPAISRLWTRWDAPICTAFYVAPAPREYLLIPRAVVITAGHCAVYGGDWLGRGFGATRAAVTWTTISTPDWLEPTNPDFAVGVVDDLRADRLYLKRANDPMNPGDRVWVAGFGWGVEKIVVATVVGDSTEYLGSVEVRAYPRTDLNPGHSGSPVLNRKGEVVGVLWGGDKTAEGDERKILVTPIDRVLTW